jgi:membrane protein YdbS with pleckstrin-like domain
MRYHSKKDGWLIGALWLGILIPVALGIALLIIGRADREAGLALLVIGVVIGSAVLILCYPLYYQITSSELVIRCGVLMHRHIPLASIDVVEGDRNPASSPAWSLDRLRVDYLQGGKTASILISPADKAAFMQELAATGAGLRVEGNRLVRVAGVV